MRVFKFLHSCVSGPELLNGEFPTVMICLIDNGVVEGRSSPVVVCVGGVGEYVPGVPDVPAVTAVR